MSERLVAADAALEQGRSPRSALGVKHRHARPRLDYFTRAYAEAALWSSSDSEEEGGEPLDRNYGVEDISSQTLAQMVQDCRKFQRENAADLEGLDEEQCGYDFWLTRNGHGVGFSDRGNLDIYDRLDEAARKYGEVNLYAHNGKVYA